MAPDFFKIESHTLAKVTSDCVTQSNSDKHGEKLDDLNSSDSDSSFDLNSLSNSIDDATSALSFKPCDTMDHYLSSSKKCLGSSTIIKTKTNAKDVIELQEAEVVLIPWGKFRGMEDHRRRRCRHAKSNCTVCMYAPIAPSRLRYTITAKDIARANRRVAKKKSLNDLSMLFVRSDENSLNNYEPQKGGIAEEDTVDGSYSRYNHNVEALKKKLTFYNGLFRGPFSSVGNGRHSH